MTVFQNKLNQLTLRELTVKLKVEKSGSTQRRKSNHRKKIWQILTLDTHTVDQKPII